MAAGWFQRLLAAAAAAIIAAASSSPLSAQIQPPDTATIRDAARIEAWNATAMRAVDMLAQPTRTDADVERLEALRAELARQRDEAVEISQSPPLGLQILLAELKALGPAPAGPKAEAPWIAERRAGLERRISEERAPLIAAEEARSRAKVLIKQIDARLVARTEQKLLVRMPSPLLPSAWSDLPSDIAKGADALIAALTPPDDATAAQRQNGWPVAALVALVGLAVAIAVQRPITRRLDRALAAVATQGGAVLTLFLRDMASLIIPGTGLFIILAAIMILVPAGPLQTAVVRFAFAAGLMIIFAAWLGRSLFSPQNPKHRFIGLSDHDAQQATQITVALGIAATFDLLVELLESHYEFADGTISALSLVVISAIAAGLWRLATLLRRHLPVTDETNETALGIRLAITRAIQAIAVIGVGMVVSGYVALSRQALDPTLLTLAMIAIGLLTYRRLTMISSAVLTDDIQEQFQSVRLLPVLYGFLISVVSIPLVALFWGVRPTTITDIITKLRNGVAIGDIRLSVGDVFVSIIIFLLGYALTRWIQRLLQTGLFPMLQIDAGVQAALLTCTGYVGLTIAALLAITSAGLDLSSLAIVAGALSVGVGLGLQGVVANFVSGVILLIERPIKPGDWIEVGGHAGIVEKISVRSTRIRTAEQDDVIIPNSEFIATAVRNRTYGGRAGRVALPVSVAYGTDLDQASTILREIADANPSVSRRVPVTVLLDDFGDSAVLLKLLCEIEDISTAPLIRSELRFEIFRRFRQAGIEIPVPQREVTLKGAVPPAPTAGEIA